MLLDSNLIVYAALPDYAALRRFISENAPAVSVISYVEVLGYSRLTDKQRRGFESFFAAAQLLPLTDEVLDRATGLRQLRSMSLGDSLIAGTALIHDLKLATHNVDDFRWVPGLEVIDPLA